MEGLTKDDVFRVLKEKVVISLLLAPTSREITQVLLVAASHVVAAHAFLNLDRKEECMNDFLDALRVSIKDACASMEALAEKTKKEVEKNESDPVVSSVLFRLDPRKGVDN